MYIACKVLSNSCNHFLFNLIEDEQMEKALEETEKSPAGQTPTDDNSAVEKPPETKSGKEEEITTENPDDTANEKQDRKSTRLNSSHANSSYAVFCL